MLGVVVRFRASGLIGLAAVALAALSALILAPDAPTQGTGTSALPAELQPASWACRSSALRANVLTFERVEPVVANGRPLNATPEEEGCSEETAQATDLDLPPNTASPFLSVETAQARTEVDPEAVPLPQQTISGFSRVEGATVDLGPGAGNEIYVGAAQATGTRSCAADSESFDSIVTDIRLGGNQISLDALLDGLERITVPALQQVVAIEVDKDVVLGEFGSGEYRHTRRALEVTLLDAAGAEEVALARVVLAEVTLGARGNPCDPLLNRLCPPGYFPDTIAGSGLCVRVVVNDGGVCELPDFRFGDVCIRLIPFPFGGGFIVPLDQIDEAQRSPCRSTAFGSALYAIVGTQGPDRITGSNLKDRIFGLGGRDRIDGGRNIDCLDGGDGGDVLDGGAGHDRVLGRAGRDIANGGSGRDRLDGGSSNDKLTGGSGHDRLYGESGIDRIFGGPGNDVQSGGSSRDYINTGNGRDRVSGGSGNDAINSATAGRPARRLACGRGRDVVRINPNERRRVARDCERVQVVRGR